MNPTLREVLTLPSFREADVEVLVGEPEAAAVRWVHSSEVYEMGNLLAGGELLLTTGLGLYGRTRTQLAAYIDQLADAGCTALAMEIGRSFFAIPPELVEAARRRGLALLALHAVVPFERMIEDFHDLLVRRRFATHPVGEAIWRDLLETVLDGKGLGALLDAVARLADCGVEIRDNDGRLLGRSERPMPAGPTATTIAEISRPAGSGARLVLGGRPTSRRVAVADRAAVCAELERDRNTKDPDASTPAQRLVADLAAGLVTSGPAMAERMAAAGFAPAPGQHIVVAAVDTDIRAPIHTLVSAVREATAPTLGTCLVGAAGTHVLVLAPGWQRPSMPRVRAALTAVAGALAATEHAAHVRAVGVATPVADPAEVAPAVAQAREIVRIVHRMGIRSGVHLAREVGVARLLAAAVDERTLSTFVDEQLGVLIGYDAQHSADLVRTLDAYVGCGGRKARTAEVLGIRRQSLWARLNRIERLLGVSLEDASSAMGLGVAITAWRLRTGLDPQAAFDRPGH